MLHATYFKECRLVHLSDLAFLSNKDYHRVNDVHLRRFLWCYGNGPGSGVRAINKNSIKYQVSYKQKPTKLLGMVSLRTGVNLDIRSYSISIVCIQST